MSQGDIVGLIASYVYAFGLLFGVEALGKRLRWPQAITRKIVHIGAGMWIWGTLALFDAWFYGIIPFATFIVLNTIFYRQQSFKAMDSRDSSPGTVYFAISTTILFALLWRTGGELDRAPIAAAGVMAMTWGDGLASLVGYGWGRHQYTFLGHTRSWEGSAAMATGGFIAMFLTLWLLPGSALSPNSEPFGMASSLVLALAGTVIATVAEGFSPAGTDNLSVPLLTGALLYLASVLL